MHKLIATKRLYGSVLAVMAVMLLIAANYVNYVVQDRARSNLEASTQQQLSHYHNLLVTNLQTHIQIVRGLPGLFAVNPNLTQAQFEIAMAHLFNDHNQLRNIGAAPDMTLRYIYPLEGNEAALGLRYRDEPEQFEAADRVRVSGQLVLAGPLELKQGGIGLVTRLPVFFQAQGQQQFWGVISAVIDSEAFFEASGLTAGHMPIRLAIRGKDGMGAAGDVFWGDPALFEAPRLTMRLDLPDGYWLLAAEPLEGWQAAMQGNWQARALIFAIALGVFALLTAFLWFMFSASRANVKFRHLIDSSPIPYMLINRRQRITYINQAFIKNYGYQLTDLRTLDDWWDKTDIDPVCREKLVQWSEGTLKSKGLIEKPFEIEVECVNGEQRVALLSASSFQKPIADELLLVIYDITLRKAAEQQLLFATQVFEQAHEGIMITDTQGMILDVNPAFTDITGYTAEEAIGQSANLLKSERHGPMFFAHMWLTITDKHFWQGEVWNQRKDGSLYAALLTISALSEVDGSIRHYLGMFSDITQIKQQQETLALMAHYDVLTKLPNRALFAERFEQAVAYSNRTNGLLGICFLDLDGFKPVNDAYGHNIGDQLLVQVAQRLAANVREEDTLARFGGDEFAIIFRDIQSVDQCRHLLDRIHTAVAQPYQVGELQLNISASSGLAIFPQDELDLDTLIRHADQAMYQAKLTGRNTYQLFNPAQNQQTIEKHQLLREISTAIQTDQLVLHYQPEVNMKTGKIMGVEALIRWQHPEKGLLMPMQFLPDIYGTIQEIALGNWVIQAALEQLARLDAQGYNVFVSVNLAASHIQSAGFVEFLQQALMCYPHIDSQRLQLEILETSALSDVGAISKIIRECRDTVGVSIALDDFGTGYSSLTHLRHLYASTVKIDQSFVRDMLDDPDDFNIIDGVIGLARTFNQQVVAEGVETLTHGKVLLLLGCELAQGYYIAKPMPVEALDEWLASYHVNPEWFAFAHQPRSTQQAALYLFMMLAERWLEQLLKVQALHADWPLLKTSECHCGKWLKNAVSQHLFEPEFIALLNVQHQQLHTLAKAFHAALSAGELSVSEWHQRLQAQFASLCSTVSDYDETL